ncbi:brachyurin-like isoform X2 [Daphnia pulicaria]|uniref:brachyurin-like isoform X2 n=1 Tax=Daphnia pulicaria TaxID=35523 RepID=UPI001EEC7D93|nr:brachyurin-like isoform X2 [Daphnia pulicaria]
MLGNQKGFSTAVVLFAVVTLLSPASSFFLPRVSRTDDAVVIDFTGVGYAPSYHSKTLYDEITSPAFVPVPSVYPYPMMYRQQEQEQEPNGWSYSFSHPITDSANRQGGGAVAIAPAAAATTTTTQCGKGPNALPARSSIDQRIVGGSTPTSANSWMYLVTLKMDGAAAGVYFCSGTLISDTKVLSAASCLENLSVFKMSQVTVSIGLRAVTGVPPPPNVQMTRRIGKVAIHSNYNALKFANNIAIITLEYPVVLSNFLVPVCLPAASTDQDQYVDQSAVIIGWGAADSATPSTVLKQGTVTVSSNADCNADANFGPFVSEANMCIASTDKFVCAGDIGGPVLVLSSPGIWTQIGINSYASGDCESNSLQTRVSAFKAWIDLYKN